MMHQIAQSLMSFQLSLSLTGFMRTRLLKLNLTGITRNQASLKSADLKSVQPPSSILIIPMSPSAGFAFDLLIREGRSK